MRLALCLLLIGCVHRVPVVSVAQDPITIDIEGCDVGDDGTNYWVGKDGMIGIGKTCEQAFHDWQYSAPPIRTARI